MPVSHVVSFTHRDGLMPRRLRGRPIERIRGVFRDPKVRIITLGRRSKNTPRRLWPATQGLV